MKDAFVAFVAKYVEANPLLPTHRLAKELQHELVKEPENDDAITVDVTRLALFAKRLSVRQLEELLDSTPGFKRSLQAGRVAWEYDSSVDPQNITAVQTVRSYRQLPKAIPGNAGDVFAHLQLRDWQVEAFTQWAKNGSTGVVEAVTGTGKTRLALAACAACLQHDGRILILVPTLELLSQWSQQLREFLPHAVIGQLGGGEHDDFSDCHVVVATPHSAAEVPIVPPGLGLLIADEAHRYGAPTWAAALRKDYEMRLALTATYERNDEGVAECLQPFFGDVIYSYGYREAARDKVIAPFSITFVPVSLSASEAAEYKKANSQANDMRQALLGAGYSKNPLKMIERAASQTAKYASSPKHLIPAEVRLARQYLTVLQKRRSVAARAESKYDVIAPLLTQHAGQKILIFTDTIDQAERVKDECFNAGHKAWVISSDLTTKERKTRLAALRSGAVNILIAPRVLDEGIDVPDTQIAIVLAAFRTRRQMIQRLGRVLRIKPDNSSASLYIVYAKATREDPKEGAQREFLAEVVDVATSVTTTSFTP